MENLPKGENLYLYKGTTYGGSGDSNNNEGGNNSNYNGNGGGGGNNPRERFQKKPQKILPTEKKRNPLGAPNAKRNTSGGNKRTPQHLAHPKKITKYKTRGGLPTTGKRGPHADREKGRPKEKKPAKGIIN